MYHFITNPKSGSGHTRSAVEKITKYLAENNIEHKFYFTERAGHATELARQITTDDVNANVVAIGGDGTFHEVLNGLSDPQKSNLGLIATGSGNDFAYAAKIPVNKPILMLKGILAGKTRSINYIDFADGHRSLNVAGTGLDIEVLLKARAYRKLKGKPSYIIAALRALKRFDAYSVDVTVDGGEVQSYDCLFAAVCNGKAFGGGMKLSPNSEIDDDKLELVVIKMIERKRIKWVMPKFISGKHIGMDFSVIIPCKSATVKCHNSNKVELDGEIYSNLNFDCSIKSGLNIFLPQQ